MCKILALTHSVNIDSTTFTLCIYISPATKHIQILLLITFFHLDLFVLYSPR